LMGRELGTLKRIEAREVWRDEARDFTPWLKDNIGVLGEALGMDLDLVDSEVAVGPFSCDLMAKDLVGDRWVVIENQLEPTDHSHLGQLLTYGAGREASVFVWLSPRFRDEHRAAVDWLNEHSDERALFFGVEIEVVVIDDAPKAAPNFKLVSSPNRWTIVQRANTSKRESSREDTVLILQRAGLVEAGTVIVVNEKDRVGETIRSTDDPMFRARFAEPIDAVKNVRWEKNPQELYSLTGLSYALRDAGGPFPEPPFNGFKYWRLESEPKRTLWDLRTELERTAHAELENAQSEART
jgi:hypothetical protein